MDTLLDLLEQSARRYGNRNALGLRRDDGTAFHWSYAEVRHRARLAAWRLRALGLQPGDRVLTWSPSTPALPAAYYGSMIARLIYVPLDSRMSPEAIANIITVSGAVRLLLGTGRDAPDPREAGLDQFPTTTIESLSEDADDSFAPDWEAQVDAWERPAPDETYQLVFTSGTTGSPKGVMLAHGNTLAGVMSFHGIIKPMEHRLVSLLPLSHSFEQAVSLFYAMDVGADILYVRSRNPRVIFDALRDHGVTTMLLVPQVRGAGLDRGRARGREAGADRDVQPAAVDRPPAPLLGSAVAIPGRSREARRRAAPVCDRRRLPPARRPAGVGGRGRHRPAGVRLHRDRRRIVHHHGRPSAGLRGLAAKASRDADRGRWRDPVPRPNAVQGLLGESAGHG